MKFLFGGRLESTSPWPWLTWTWRHAVRRHSFVRKHAWSIITNTDERLRKCSFFPSHSAKVVFKLKTILVLGFYIFFSFSARRLALHQNGFEWSNERYSCNKLQPDPRRVHRIDNGKYKRELDSAFVRRPRRGHHLRFLAERRGDHLDWTDGNIWKYCLDTRVISQTDAIVSEFHFDSAGVVRPGRNHNFGTYFRMDHRVPI